MNRSQGWYHSWPQAAENTNMELEKEVKLAILDLEAISVWTVVEAKGMDELTPGDRKARKEDQAQNPKMEGRKTTEGA